MGSLLPSILPLALGAAVSPTLATLVIAVLASGPEGLRRGVALTVGATIPLFIIAVVVILTFHTARVEEAGPRHQGLDGIVDLVAAVLLAVVAFRALQPAKTPQEKQAERAQKAPGGPGRFVALGVGIMLVNFTSLALFVPAMKDIARAKGVDGLGEALAAALVIFIALIPAWAPVALCAAFPERAQAILQPLRTWIQTHQRAVGGWVSAVFAAYLAVKGVLEIR